MAIAIIFFIVLVELSFAENTISNESAFYNAAKVIKVGCEIIKKPRTWRGSLFY
jgi:ketopantoate hydroxymethyltransferase